MTTPTLHQAAQVALDALEPLSAYGRVGTRDVDQAALQQVCAALREALAQPQAEPVDQQIESINAVFDAWRNGEDASMTLALSAPPADGDRVEAAIDDYIDGYVMEGDDGYYQPNDGDTAMLKDAMMGLLVDPGFLAAYDGTPPAAPQAEPVARVAEVHMSRYTIEWTNGPLPEGANLYAAPPAAPADDHATPSGGQEAGPQEDRIEAAYWRFDARHKGYSQWKTAPMSERDAFKAEMRNALEAEKVRAEMRLVARGWRRPDAPAAPASQWMPIDTAPKDGTLFLCWVAAVRCGETDEGRQYEEDVSQLDFCYWRTQSDTPDGGWFDPCCGQIGDQQRVTHWMPLPAAPDHLRDVAEKAAPAAPPAAPAPVVPLTDEQIRDIAESLQWYEGDVERLDPVQFARAVLSAAPAVPEGNAIKKPIGDQTAPGGSTATTATMDGFPATNGASCSDSAPAVREPLTDEQLAKIAVEDEFLLYCDQDSFNEIARAIEQAHGITGGGNE